MTDPISLIVPVFNEEGNLKRLQESIRGALEPTGLLFEVLYIDDGSTDGSRAELQEMAEADPRVRVIEFVRNYGQTAALTAGIRNASHGILITLDADLQNDPSDIPFMLEKLNEGYDVVCGWRKDRQDSYLTRTLPSKMANALISSLSKVHLHDYGCTLRVYKREYIEHIPLYGEMHRFIPIYVTWAGARLVEVPVRHHARTVGESKYGLSRIPKVLLDLTTVKFLRDFYVTPIYFFGWLGFLLFFAGLVTAVVAGLAWTVLDSPPLAVALTVVAPMLMIFGVVEVTLGVVAEVLIRMHYDIRDKAPYRVRRTLNMTEAAKPSESSGG